MDSPERLNAQSSSASSKAHDVAFQATTSGLDGWAPLQPSIKDRICARAAVPESKFSCMALGPSLDRSASTILGTSSPVTYALGNASPYPRQTVTSPQSHNHGIAL